MAWIRGNAHRPAFKQPRVLTLTHSTPLTLGHSRTDELRIPVLLVALGALSIGIFVYLLDRQHAPYFLSFIPARFFPRYGVLAFASGWLPSFCHTFAFCLLTAELLRPWPKLAASSFLFWLVVESAFEFSQITWIANAIIAWLSDISASGPPPIVARYLVSSTFDLADLGAVACAVIGAALVYYRCNQGVRT